MDVNVAAWGPKSKGVTPLHLAAEGGHLEVMDELLERGANIDARTKGACGCKCLDPTFFLFCCSRVLIPKVKLVSWILENSIIWKCINSKLQVTVSPSNSIWQLNFIS